MVNKLGIPSFFCNNRVYRKNCTGLILFHIKKLHNIVTCQPIVGLRNRALLGSRPLNASRPNTRYAAVGEEVFIPCRFEPREVEDRAVPSRAAPQRFQGNDL
jgi:hypothetical protein